MGGEQVASTIKSALVTIAKVMFCWVLWETSIASATLEGASVTPPRLGAVAKTPAIALPGKTQSWPAKPSPETSRPKAWQISSSWIRS